MTAKHQIVDIGDRAVALYHVVYEHEGFEHAAQALFKIVQLAQVRCPGKTRKLFLDIEGHRNSQGSFDADMLELQQGFLLGFLGRFLTEIHFPLASVRNPAGQDNDIPPALIVQDNRGQQ